MKTKLSPSGPPAPKELGNGQAKFGFRPPTAPQALLAGAAFLVPIIGGYPSVEAQPLGPGAVEVLRSMFGGSQTPLLSHALLAVLAATALCIQLLRSRVVQLPFSPVSISLAALCAAVLASTGLSEFGWPSLTAASEWLSYAVVFVAAATSCGRKEGLLWVIGAFALGCAVLASVATLEYGASKVNDPAWRVFGTWINPNALAGMLILGLFAALGLCCVANRVRVILWGGASALIVVALYLSQSRGGLLASSVGLATFVIAILAWKPSGARRRFILRTGAAVVAGVLLVGLMRWTPATSSGSPGSTAAFARISGGDSEGHSTGFRRLLWLSAWRLLEKHPGGTGIGTFRFHASKPGLVPQTQLAHQSYLQLGAETGWLGLGALAALGIFWLREMLRGAKRQPTWQIFLKAGLLAAFAAGALHNAIDSDLYVFGTGFGMFLLLGVGLASAADALTPEQLPLSLRLMGCVSAFLPSLFLVGAGYEEALKARIVGDLKNSEITSALRGMEQLQVVGALDGDAWLLTSQSKQSRSGQIASLERACQLQPSPRMYRALATAHAQAGEFASAIADVNRALDWDRNNLQSLSLLLELYEMTSDEQGADETARKLIAVENTAYFKVRAIPEYIPINTYQARISLYSKEKDPRKRIEGLLPALEGMRAFKRITVPRVAAAARIDANITIAGFGLVDTANAMGTGWLVADALATAYREIGDAPKAAAAEREAGAFKATEAELRSLAK